MSKNTLLPLLAVSAFTLAGCGKKEQPPASPTPPPAPVAATAQPSALDSAKQTAANVGAQAQKAGQQLADQGKQVATQVADQAKTVAVRAGDQAKTAVTQVKDEAKSFADQFKKPAATTAAAPSGPTDYTALAQKVSDSAKSLLANPAVSQPVKDQLAKLTASVLADKDGDASGALAQIVALKPSDDQMGVVKEIQANFGVLALGRNFDANDPASGGAVTQTIGAIKSGDIASVVAGLQKVGASAKLTDAQKGIVTNLVSSYGGSLAGVTDSVNKAAGVLKGFGL